jgi:molybdopterin-guanine dinucleotide biosynthesis protein A
MGEDKALLPFRQTPTLTQYQYNKLSKLFKNVYLSSKNNKFDFINDDKIIFDNLQNNSSPMIALDSIFDFIKNDKVFIITVDTPLVEEDTIKKLIESSEHYDVTIAKDSDKTHNLCGVFSKQLSNKIKELIHDDIHKINFLIKRYSKYKEVLFKNESQFININEYKDYQKALNISINY